MKNRIITLIKVMILLLLFIFVFSNKTKAASNDNVQYEKIVTPYTGTIKINLTNMQLENTHQFSFAISNEKNKQSTDLVFHNIESGYTQSNASILLDSSIEDIKNVLKSTDTAYLYLKDIDTDSIILSDYEIDISIPYAETFKVFQEKNMLWQIKKVYGISNLYYNTVVITDSEILNKYINLKSTINKDAIILNGDTETINNSNIEKLEVKFDIPTEWKPLQTPSSSFTEKEPVLPYETVPNTPNLYLVWIKAKDNDSKDLYGYFLVNRLPNGGLTADVSYNPTTNTEKEVTATITANREIKEVNGWKLSDDKTKLTKVYTKNTVESVTVRDNNNNSVKLEIVIDNIIEKQNDKESDSDSSNNNETETEKDKNNNQNLSNNDEIKNKKDEDNLNLNNNIDSTVAKTEIPFTGVKMYITCGILLIFVITTGAYIKYVKYKDL